MSITYWKTPITSLTTSKNNIIITDNSFDPRFYSLSLSLYMLVSTLVTYSSTMSNSSSTTYLSATIPTTFTTSPTSLLLTLSSAQPPATSSNCTFYSLKMLFDDHLGVHLGDLVGLHGHLQLLLWDVLDPLAYVWSLSMLKQLKKSWVGIFISMYCMFSQWPNGPFLTRKGGEFLGVWRVSVGVW